MKLNSNQQNLHRAKIKKAEKSGFTPDSQTEILAQAKKLLQFNKK